MVTCTGEGGAALVNAGACVTTIVTICTAGGLTLLVAVTTNR